MPKQICPHCGGTGQKIDHQKLARLRHQSRCTLKEIASKMGISLQYLSDMERGRRNWSPNLYKKFMEVVS